MPVRDDATTPAEKLIYGQPRGVWAVLGAGIVAFMGIGLVDPILPIIAKGLHATGSQVELLFTSYFLIIGISNLLSGFFATRIGAKRTLMFGLLGVVVCSALAGASNTVAAVVGFRAGWGLGIALFVSTSMSIIVGSAVGGPSRAVVLFESALGIGIASGPLLGGLLGGVSWRLPFFGVAVLMAIAFAAILFAVRPTPAPPREQRIGLAEPLRALGHKGLLIGSVVALLYNFGFFTLLAYTPLPLGLGVHQLGLVFFGWGILVAFGAIYAAPRLMQRFAPPPLLTLVLVLVAADLLAIGFGIHSKTVMVVAIVLSGLVLGAGNALLSTILMGLSGKRPAIGASATNFIRFVGGAAAPFLAGKLAEHVSPAAPLYMGAGAVVVGAVVLGLSVRVVSESEELPAVASAVGGLPAGRTPEQLAAEEELEYAA
jgi:predicted MFS family arabinose efflux permease